MDSLSICLLSSPISQNKNPNFHKLKTPNSHSTNKTPKSTTNSFNSNLKSLKTQSLSSLFTSFQFQFPLSSYSSDQSPTDQSPTKIDLESIVVSIDDFFNRYPFFVAGVVFIWLFVIPATEEYLRKYKFISAIDAFKKLKDDPNSQLLDIRDGKTLRVLGSPNLKFLNKDAVQVEFRNGDDEGFVKKVKDNIKDPANTTVCILDNFDGESMKVAELLFKNGFKEAYAIRGGVRGNNGWLEIQETLLPPSVRISLKRKVKKSTEAKNNGSVERQSEVKKSTEAKNNGAIEQQSEVKKSTGVSNNGVIEQQSEVKKSTGIKNNGAIGQTNLRSSSPYPMYPDMKPPSSPTPSKPQ